MSDDRNVPNFRYGYYEKVGFGGIEEKKSLEILLRDKPTDLARLSTLTSRYSLSPNQRKQVWQILLELEVIPDNRIIEYRTKVQREITRSIIDALELMRLVETSLVKMEKLDFSLNGHPKLLLLIFLFETNQLESNIKQQVCLALDKY